MLRNILIKLMAPEFQNKLSFDNYIINYGKVCLSEVGQCSNTAAHKKSPPFLETKVCFAMKIEN